MLQVCLELDSDTTGYMNVAEFEHQYQTVFKSLIAFLYSHPKVHFSLNFNGMQLSYYEEKHPEILDIIRELTCRHQVEVLGGGYYSPVFPLLFPVDRSGQIEKLTSLLRNTVGKRPVGMSLYGSIWDPSLVTTFQSCGMSYVHLDGTLIPPSAKKGLFPLITSEQGKALFVLPSYDTLLPDADTTPEDWIAKIKKTAVKDSVKNKDNFKETFDQIITIIFPIDKFASFMKKETYDYLDQLCSSPETAELEFTTPQLYLKNAKKFISAYIPAGMNWQIAQWAMKPFTKCENRTRFPLTIHDFLNTYPQNRHLYERMMYMSMITLQCHGDKIRKAAAHEKLWEAQCGCNYVNLPDGLPATAKLRQHSYRVLNEAEKLVRDSKEYAESVTSYDYNNDGRNEYVCKMEKYHAVISLKAGQITELDIINSGCNYAANYHRVKTFDEQQDLYNRGIFVEHLIDHEEMKKYLSGEALSSTIFSDAQFEEKKFNPKRKEIQMEGKGLFSSMQLPVSLRKNYIVSSSGFIVQYIIKNDSPLPLKGIFVVESNFTQTDFTTAQNNQYSSELIENGTKKEIKLNESCSIGKGVSLVQITDSKDKTSFVFEPNEDAGFCWRIYPIKRMFNQTEIQEVSESLAAGLFWNIELAPGMEIERTINLSLIPSKNKRKNK